MFTGIARTTIEIVAALAEGVDAEAREALDRVGEVDLVLVRELAQLVRVVEHLVHRGARCPRARARRRPSIGRSAPSMRVIGGAPRLQVEVGAVVVDEVPQGSVEIQGHCSSRIGAFPRAGQGGWTTALRSDAGPRRRPRDRRAPGRRAPWAPAARTLASDARHDAARRARRRCVALRAPRAAQPWATGTLSARLRRRRSVERSNDDRPCARPAAVATPRRRATSPPARPSRPSAPPRRHRSDRLEALLLGLHERLGDLRVVGERVAALLGDRLRVRVRDVRSPRPGTSAWPRSRRAPARRRGRGRRRRAGRRRVSPTSPPQPATASARTRIGARASARRVMPRIMSRCGGVAWCAQRNRRAGARPSCGQ